MIIDCMSCVARPTECGDCVVSVVLGPHPDGLDLDLEERTAMAVLAGSGLVPPLRLTPAAGARDKAVPAECDADQPPARWTRRQRAG